MKRLFGKKRRMDLMARRAEMMEPTVYYSSKGLLYHKKMTYDLTDPKNQNSGRTIEAITSEYGTMEHLEELTLTGRIGCAATGANGYASGELWKQMPNLKTLIISPTYSEATAIASGTDTSSFTNGWLTFGHYMFNYTNLKKLVLGTQGLVPFISGGYYRQDAMDGKTGRIGSKDGLTIIAYMTEYSASAGFYAANGMGVCQDTTIICRDWQTGEILTA